MSASLEPVSSGLFLRGLVQDAENTPEIGKLDEIFRRVLALLEVPGQTAIAVGERAEGGLDPPPHRQRHEATGRRIAEGDLDINAVTLGRRANGRPGVDAIDLDPLKVPASFGSPSQERCQAVRVMQVGRRDEHGEDEAERAGQDMALDAPDLLVAVNTARAFLRTRYDPWRIDDSRRRLRVLAQARPCGRGQQRGGIGPYPVTMEAVPVAAHGRPGTELLGQAAPAAALGRQINTAVDHLTNVPGQGRIGLDQRPDQRPFRLAQIARIAPAIVLVTLAVLPSPHPTLTSSVRTKIGLPR